MIWEKAFKEDGSLNKDELYLFCNSLNAVAPVMLREFGNEWRPISNKFAVQCGRYIQEAQGVIHVLMRRIEELESNQNGKE